MNKKNLIILPIISLSLLNCSCNTTTESVSRSYSEDDISSLRNTYGSFSIARDDGGENNYSFDESNNTYTINVEENKAEYIISGYSDAHFVIQNGNNITEHKGIKIKLNKACLISKDENPVFDYTLDKKNIELKAEKNSKNLLLALESANTINSQANIEVTGSGNIEIFSKGAETGGHTFRASEEIYLYDKVNLIINSGHDGFHCEGFYSTNISETNSSKYSGICRFGNIYSQAIEATTSSANGRIYLNGGSYYIESCDSVFKSDNLINIFLGVKVIANKTISAPVIKQSQDEVMSYALIGDLKLINEGYFLANGEEIKTQNF